MFICALIVFHISGDKEKVLNITINIKLMSSSCIWQLVTDFFRKNLHKNLHTNLHRIVYFYKNENKKKLQVAIKKKFINNFD